MLKELSAKKYGKFIILHPDLNFVFFFLSLKKLMKREEEKKEKEEEAKIGKALK